MRRGGSFLDAKVTVLEKLDYQFLQQHQQLARAELKAINHVIVLKQGVLSLWKENNNAWTQIAVNKVNDKGDKYHLLKTTAHLPFIIKNIISNVKSLAGLRLVLGELQQDLIKLLQENPDIPKDAEKIVKHSMEYIASLLKDDAHKSIEDYIAYLKPYINNNGQQATILQMKSFNDINQEWMKKHNINLKSTRVIIVGPHGPRDGMIEKEYYKGLYKSVIGIADAENDRVYYAEMLPDHINQLDIKRDLIEKFLGAAEHNKSYGLLYSNDRKAMFRDVLASHAPLALMGLFAKKSQCPIKLIRETVARYVYKP